MKGNRHANGIVYGCGLRYCRGQSLVEVCVACIALVPLAIGLVYIGQYIHVKHTMQQAAREAAWDAAVSPAVYKVSASLDADSEQARLRARYFAKPSAPISVEAQSPHAFADSLLTEYDGNTLLQPGKFTIATYKDEATPGLEGQISGVMSTVTKELKKLDIANTHGGQFPPDPNGYLTAEVNAETEKSRNFKPLDRLDLNFHAQTVLLADAWNADGSGENDEGQVDTNGMRIPDRSVRSAITYLAPGTALFGGKLGSTSHKILKIIGQIPILDDFYPSLDKFEPGRTSPDVVPFDKLQPYKE